MNGSNSCLTMREMLDDIYTARQIFFRCVTESLDKNKLICLINILKYKKRKKEKREKCLFYCFFFS